MSGCFLIACSGDSTDPGVAPANPCLPTEDCTPTNEGPSTTVTGVLRVLFRLPVGGVVPVSTARITVVRQDDGTVSFDSTIAIAAQSDSIDLSLTIAVLSVSDTLLLNLVLTAPAGDTVFVGGPIPAIANTGGSSSTPAIEIPLDYVGAGSNARAVTILNPDTVLTPRDTLLLEAAALDSLGQPIVGTPIFWMSLDSTVLRVPDVGVGRVFSTGTSGDGLIVAELLTGPADTVLITVP